MDIVKILEAIRPNAEWALRGTTYEGLEWLDLKQEKPTLEELQAGESLVLGTVYREQRAREYPPIGDQLDALWKGGDAAAEMLARVNAVKEKFPKPI